jgi:hypothetical protein
MSAQMYIVGGVLFAVYIYFTIWNIMRNNRSQNTNDRPEQSHHDPVDMDGMGNFSRFPTDKQKK